MARFDVHDRGGRGGRFGSTYPARPKWLNTPAPKLMHKAPNLSSNPYSPLQKQFTDGSSFIDQSSLSLKPSNLNQPSNSNTNGWKTFFNNSRNSRKKTINKTNLSVKYNELHRQSLIATQAKSPQSTHPSSSYFKDTDTLSHKTLRTTSEISTENLPPVSSLISTMPSETATLSTSPSPMDIDSNPSTPERGRRDKKSRQNTLDPNSTPSKKRCETRTSSTDDDIDMDEPMDSASNKSPTKDKGTSSTKKYLQISSSCSEETIKSMSTENLLKELVKISSKVGTSITFDTTKTLPKTVLIQRALDFRKKIAGHAYNNKKSRFIFHVK